MSIKQPAPAEAAVEAERGSADTGVTPDALPIGALGGEPGQPFTGFWHRLDRISRVRSGTVALLSTRRNPPTVKTPGELLLPGWPLGGAVDVLVVTTEPVTLPVRVQHLSTLDHEDLDYVELEVPVQLQPARLPALLERFGEDFGAALLQEAKDAIESSVRAAVGLNRAADLQRQSLAQVLEDRWLPTSLVRDSLARVGLTVRRVGWASTPDDDTQEIPLAVDEEQQPQPPILGVANLTSPRSGSTVSADRALQLVHVPAAISVGACWLFFVGHWLPELGSIPGVAAVLEQFSPLASKEITSGGEPVVAAQADRSGVLAAFLLAVSLLLAPLARARFWLARLSLWPLTYLAAVAAAVTLLTTVARGRLAAEFLGVALLVAWVVCAAVSTWRSLWVDVDGLPRRPDRVLWLLFAFALLSPAPVAVGRGVFAPELREAALTVLDNDLTLRWTALLTPATGLLYLCGLLLGVLVWVGYLLWPPRAAASPRVPLVALTLALVGLVVLTPAAVTAAGDRVEVLRTQSPGQEIGFSCGVWTRQGRGGPVQTLVVTGLQCRRVATFSGYREVSSIELAVSVSPVRAETFDGRRLAGKILGAQYGDVLVLAATDRFDNRVTQLVALRLDNGAVLWRHPCRSDDAPRLRFAGSSQGDDSAAGRLTRVGERAKVVVNCGEGEVQLDPRTGRRR